MKIKTSKIIPPKGFIAINLFVGQFLLIRKMNSHKVYIRTTDNNRIHTDGSTTTSVDIKAGRGDMSMVIFDGIYWTYNFFGR